MAQLFLMEVFVVAFVGLVLGSFATALIWRVPRGIRWARGGSDGKPFARSACPACNRTLQAVDLVPVLSWLALRGKCRFCAAPIDLRYPATEALTVAGCLGIYAVWGFTAPAFLLMAAVCLLVALLVIDLDHMILPDQLNLLLAAIALALVLYQWVVYDFSYGFGRQALLKLAGVVIYGLTALAVGWIVGLALKKEALGMGDIKFFAVAGLFLGLTYLPFFMICGGLVGVFIGGFYQLALKKAVFPFGPALIIALYCGLILQGLEIVPFIGVQ